MGVLLLLWQLFDTGVQNVPLITILVIAGQVIFNLDNSNINQVNASPIEFDSRLVFTWDLSLSHGMLLQYV